MSMMIVFACPHCGEKTFSLFRKSSLIRRGIHECENCGSSCEISWLFKLVASLLMAFLMPTLFIVFFGINGFVFSTVLTTLLILMIYVFLIYISPLRIAQKAEGK